MGNRWHFACNESAHPKLEEGYPIDPLDGPYSVQTLLGIAMVELRWQPSQFYQCSTKDFGAALVYLRNKRNADYFKKFTDHKRIVFSVAEVFVGNPQKLNEYFEIKTAPQAPLAQQPNKVDKLMNHFKDKI